VIDEFTERYAGLVTGSYECVDRIVLNAYFSLGHNPGGFRVWWRQLHDGSDELPDNSHLMRFAGPVRPSGAGLGRRPRGAGSTARPANVSTTSPNGT
jgi:hypothetical protein